MSTHPIQPLRGYTLLEMIVSLGIFAVVMLIVMGAYLTLISLDRQSRSTNQLTSSLSFVVESMARSIRTGSHYCDTAIAGESACSPTSFSFVNADGTAQTYLLKNDGSIGSCTGGCTAANASSITDSRIIIQGLTFTYRGIAAHDTLQPMVTFTIQGYIQLDRTKSTQFNIQSTATQRFIDI